MVRPAVAVAPDSELNQQLTTLGRQIGYGRGLRPGRAQILLIVLVIVGFWLVLVYGRALGQINEATAREATVAGEAQALQMELDAGRRELALVQSDAFQSLQARAIGMGKPGERVFALASGAPEPAPIVPLGHSAAPAAPKTPLEAWLELLLGH
jgi:hypothetical protein